MQNIYLNYIKVDNLSQKLKFYVCNSVIVVVTLKKISKN